MKLSKDTKDSIDKWLDNKTPEEVYYIISKYTPNKQLPMHDFVGQSEQLVCDECNGWGYTVDKNGRRKAHCTKCD